MLKSLRILLAVCFLSNPVLAQYGSAPNGYYPHSYFGATFTGTLEVTKGDPQEITLVYSKGAKSERFVGKLETPCHWKTKDGVSHSFENSEAWKNTVLTAFYKMNTKKSGGQKVSENVIIAFSVSEVDGLKVAEGKRIIIYCSKDTAMQFKAF